MSTLEQRLIGEDQTADDIVCWLADFARQDGAPPAVAEWLDQQHAAKVCGTSLTRVLDWPRADYGSAWAELRGFLGESVRSGYRLDLSDLAYVDDLHSRALKPVADWMRSRGPDADVKLHDEVPIKLRPVVAGVVVPTPPQPDKEQK